MPTTPERSPDALKGEIYVSPYALRVKSESIREEMLPPKTHWRQMFDRVVAQVRQVRVLIVCGSILDAKLVEDEK